MKLHWFVVLLLHVLSLGMAGQATKEKPVPPPAVAPAHPEADKLPPGITVTDESFLFSPEDKMKIRDAQFQADQLEIQIQKMQVEIEKDKAKEADYINAMKAVAFDFSQKKQIDLNVYEFDPTNLKMTKKKKAK